MTSRSYTRVRVVLAGEPVETHPDDIVHAYTSAKQLPDYIPPNIYHAWSQGDYTHTDLHFSLRVNPYDEVTQPEMHAAWIQGWRGLPLQRDQKES